LSKGRAILVASAVLLAVGATLLLTAPPPLAERQELQAADRSLLQRVRTRVLGVKDVYLEIPLAEVLDFLQEFGRVASPTAAPAPQGEEDPAGKLAFQARSAQAAGKLEEAERLFLELRSRYPDYPDVAAELAEVQRALAERRRAAARAAKLREAQQAYDQRRYRDALRIADAVLAEAPEHPEAIRLKQLASLAIRKLTPAGEPTSTPPPPTATPPPGTKPPVQPPSARLLPIERLLEGGNGAVRVEIKPDHGVAQVVVYFKHLKKRRESYAVMKRGDDGIYRADVPESMIRRPGFEYRVEILDQLGRPVLEPLHETVTVEKKFEIAPVF